MHKLHSRMYRKSCGDCELVVGVDFNLRSVSTERNGIGARQIAMRKLNKSRAFDSSVFFHIPKLHLISGTNEMDANNGPAQFNCYFARISNSTKATDFLPAFQSDAEHRLMWPSSTTFGPN